MLPPQGVLECPFLPLGHLSKLDGVSMANIQSVIPDTDVMRLSEKNLQQTDISELLYLR